jgi:hypothetical protein
VFNRTIRFAKATPTTPLSAHRELLLRELDLVSGGGGDSPEFDGCVETAAGEGATIGAYAY